jgi:two-component system nitrogen regulation response regulator NtrX
MSKRILIIDDEESIRESVAGILSDEGFKTLAVGSAEEGLRSLEEENIDLVLLDIWMPGMDGMEALPIIKEQFPHLPVVMVSGHGTIETAVQATKMGAYDFIEKPPSYDKIVLAIKNALHLAELEQENIILRQKNIHRTEYYGESPAIVSVK